MKTTPSQRVTSKPTPNSKRIRQAIKGMVELGASPDSIVFAMGRIFTPEERDYLLDYEKKYQEKSL